MGTTRQFGIIKTLTAAPFIYDFLNNYSIHVCIRNTLSANYLQNNSQGSLLSVQAFLLFKNYIVDILPTSVQPNQNANIH